MSDQEVRDYLQARYGDFVLYDPPFNTRTWYIWLVPVGLGLLALFVLYRLQRSARGEHHGLDAEQQKRLRELWVVRRIPEIDVCFFPAGTVGTALCASTGMAVSGRCPLSH